MFNLNENGNKEHKVNQGDVKNNKQNNEDVFKRIEGEVVNTKLAKSIQDIVLLLKEIPFIKNSIIVVNSILLFFLILKFADTLINKIYEWRVRAALTALICFLCYGFIEANKDAFKITK